MKYEAAKKRRRVHQPVEMFEILNKDTVREAIREITDGQASRSRQTPDVGFEDPLEGNSVESDSGHPIAVTPIKTRTMKTRIAARQKCWDDADEDTRKAVLDAIAEERTELEVLKAEEPGLDKKSPRELQE